MLCWDMIGLTDTTRDSTRDHDPPLTHPGRIQDLPPFRPLLALGIFAVALEKAQQPPKR